VILKTKTKSNPTFQVENMSLPFILALSVFLLTRVYIYIFYQCCFVVCMFWSNLNISSAFFCETVLLKITTSCQGVVWFVPFKCGIVYTGFLLEHKNTHFDCVFGQKMPTGILSFLSFMKRDEFILLCNGKI
jgi:hypothetical protein